MKSYTINGKSFTQKTLTLNQSDAMMELIEDLDLSGVDGVTSVIKILRKNDLLRTAMSILLIPEGQDNTLSSIAEIDKESIHQFDEVDLDTVNEVISDFFTLNKNWMKNISSSLNLNAIPEKILELAMMMVQKPSEKSDTSSLKEQSGQDQ